MLDAYNWRAHIGFMETKQGERKMIKLVETRTFSCEARKTSTILTRYYMDGKRVSEAEWMDTFSNVYKTLDDAANAHMVVERAGINKVRYTWYA